MNKFMTAADMVAQLKSGMTIGVGGWGPRRKPMALIREIVRSDLKDLTVVAYGGHRLGNTQTEGPDTYFDDVFARAAEKTFVSCEEVYDRLDHSHPEGAKNNLFERYLVSGIIHVPFGAHPSSYPARYGWDMD